ncbi:PucR family transcriptional regulator [Acetonema longum]|uniref:PucR family transcriptional regulator n=1 Tax=Acetonema longum DSM 6540 TaxID=1009370 RepID=F7NDI1_9FIRM|nr:PucR family transcriptional regulator ligand-binding domain-containing protein [Acetonema longum]EGO65843.1 PucR family transcriptional regulator [Acetonema longum DSM 6540]
MNKDIGLSLKEVLELLPFAQSKPVAGHGGLDKVVRSVNIMEVPDILAWTKPGELLLTTAYSIRDNLPAQQNLVPELASKGLVGLAIKPGRYIERIPIVMMDQADQLQFPLIELSAEVAFPDLINAVLTATLDKQNDYLSRSLNSHRLFMDIVSFGGDLADMARSLAQIIENTVLIYDAKHQRLVGETVNWPIEDIQLLWRCEDKDRVELPVQSRTYLTELPDFTFRIMELPVASGHEVYGKVVVAETNRPLTGQDILIIERLATVAALEIANRHAIMQIERRYANEFLDQLLFSSLDDDLRNRARFFGWDLCKPYVAILFQYENAVWQGMEIDNEIEKKRNEINNRIYLEVAQRCRGHNCTAIPGTKSNVVVLLLEVVSKESKQAYREIRKAVESLRQVVTPLVKEGWITIGTGRYYPEPGGYQKSYQEAVKALKIGKETGCSGQNVYFQDLGIYRLFALIEKKNELEEFLEENILPLMRYDAEKNSDLLLTLEMFFHYHGNAKKVSEKLFTHYNTILYRLDRIQEITGMNLDDPEDRLNLQVALRIRKLIQRG